VVDASREQSPAKQPRSTPVCGCPPGFPVVVRAPKEKSRRTDRGFSMEWTKDGIPMKAPATGAIRRSFRLHRGLPFRLLIDGEWSDDLIHVRVTDAFGPKPVLQGFLTES